MTDSILRLPAVKTRTGLSRSTIYLRVSQGTFPRPVSLGGRAVGWVEENPVLAVRENCGEPQGRGLRSGHARQRQHPAARRAQARI
jgi:prophage regulatory protein